VCERRGWLLGLNEGVFLLLFVRVRFMVLYSSCYSMAWQRLDNLLFLFGVSSSQVRWGGEITINDERRRENEELQ
jgi:hypothetical protein